MRTVRFAQMSDRDFWFRLDRHLPEAEFGNKVELRRAYVLEEDGAPAGILRYNLFWDNTPFCTLLYVDPAHQRAGCGRALMESWEAEMRLLGYRTVLTSTQADEPAQHFYRRLGYRDCGGMVLEGDVTELILVKRLA